MRALKTTQFTWIRRNRSNRLKTGPVHNEAVELTLFISVYILQYIKATHCRQKINDESVVAVC